MDQISQGTQGTQAVTESARHALTPHQRHKLEEAQRGLVWAQDRVADCFSLVLDGLGIPQDIWPLCRYDERTGQVVQYTPVPTTNGHQEETMVTEQPLDST